MGSKKLQSRVKQADAEIEQTISEIDSPVVERLDKVEDSIEVMRENNLSIRNMLQEVDKSKPEGEVSLVDVWDRVSRFRDTNEMIRLNLQQIQQMLHEAYENHHRKKIEDRKVLKDLFERAKEDPAMADTYATMKRDVEADRDKERKLIQSLAMTSTVIAKEYRSCVMQRAFFVHISMIQQFAVLVAASIQRNITDPNVWRAISRDILQAKRICFPAQEKDLKEID